MTLIQIFGIFWKLSVVFLVAFGAGHIVGSHGVMESAKSEIRAIRAESMKMEKSFFCAARDPIPGFPCKCWQKKGGQ